MDYKGLWLLPTVVFGGCKVLTYCHLTFYKLFRSILGVSRVSGALYCEVSTLGHIKRRVAPQWLAKLSMDVAEGYLKILGIWGCENHIFTF